MRHHRGWPESIGKASRAAYGHIGRGRLVAVSARTTDRLHAFASQFNVPNTYTDYRAMFEAERPDVVHVNTPPNVRLEILKATEEAEIPAVIVEKPIAIASEDFRGIREFARKSNIRIAVNHQLHFQPRRFDLQERVANGDIGDIRFIEASCGMNLAYQGTMSCRQSGRFIPPASL